MFSDGEAYERTMGRWSRPVGAQFIDWLGAPRGLNWVDVGCGNGAFTEVLIERCAPAAVSAIDPSPGQVAYARSRVQGQKADYQVGDAQALPYPDKSFDAAAMALVIIFIPDAQKAVAEMARVVKPGGLVATYMWDIPGGLPMAPMYAAMKAAGFQLPAPPGSPNSHLPQLQALWQGAGLVALETTTFRIPVVFADFDEFWATNTMDVGPMAKAIAGMAPDARAEFRTRLAKSLPADASGRVAIEAYANAIKGRVPH
jgi:ubiquinone/menaquinone biosynthesis C-methylase UbiE